MIIDPHSVKGGSRHDCRLDYKNREYSRRLTIVIQIIIREFSESDAFYLSFLLLKGYYTLGSVLCKQSVPSGRAPLCTLPKCCCYFGISIIHIRVGSAVYLALQRYPGD